ncbi:SCO0930 family lipoprotein [Streptomyces antimicrobicus]|uniref:SCO0930 family lipoprotein n=1 Tax=Streptomyces antimicrobicus TaxID=2883108 RepID=A0ABS8B605_9ACTN|nr:SCO0930 family lipoprotein [Streptomyces antimicrobicus]MCB5180044.1 SCO0930 family lipoprotein [Streptomyces antimicrobicus]
MGAVRGTSLAAVAVAVAVALTATACGGTEDKAGDAAKGAGAGAAAPAQAPAGAAVGPGGQLAVRQDAALGPVLVDGAGFTLYRFDKDTAKPPTSTCDGDCAKAWPPVPAADAKAAAGTDPSLLGEVVRPDGSKQLTVAGWPAYRFAKDTAPGETKGQGVGGTWFALAPDGKKAAKAAGDGAGNGGGGNGAGSYGDGYGNGGGAGGAAPAALPGLSVAKDPKLGDHVVDRNGMTVYRFKPDTAWPMVSKCTGDCLAKWPVVAPVDKADTKGVTERNYLVLDRPDGKKQQTIDCWPVYTFTGDKKPGDINGQGVGGTWYAVAPDGKLITTQ